MSVFLGHPVYRMYSNFCYKISEILPKQSYGDYI